MSSYYSDHRVNNCFFNYGYVKKGSKKYRNALRYAKKMEKKYWNWINKGFDYSELWNLDQTFYSFLLAHNYIPKEYIYFFKILKNDDFWDESICKLYNLTNEENIPTKEDIQTKYNEIIKKEIEYINHLPINEKIIIKTFIIPRIKEFKEKTNSYPAHYTESEWDKILEDIVKDVDKMVFESLFEHIPQMWY